MKRMRGDTVFAFFVGDLHAFERPEIPGELFVVPELSYLL